MADEEQDELDAELDEIPKLPRGSFFKFLRWGDLIRIAMLGSFLVMVIVLRKPCAEGTANFVRSFDAPIDAGPTPTVDAGMKLIRLTGQESEAELRAKLGRNLPADAGKPVAPPKP